MVIAGVTCYPNRWPRPDTKVAMEWTRTDVIRYRATVRPQSNDAYFSDIEIWDTQAKVDELFTALKDPANLGAVTIDLGNEDERFIFGADVLCTSATVMEYGMPREAGSYKMFSLSLRLKALSPTFVGTAAWPDEFYAQPGWTAGATFGLEKLSSYDNTMTYQNSNNEEGIYEGQFLLFTDGMQNLRRQLITVVRGSSVQFPYFGVTNVFGPTLPFNESTRVRVVDWKDMGRQNYELWGISIKLAYDGQEL